jgi:hypothetical protein
MVEKVALEQDFSEYFGFSCQSSFRQLLHNHQHLSFGPGTIIQLVSDVPNGRTLTEVQEGVAYFSDICIHTKLHDPSFAG